jgi:hypothetical protein
LILLGALERLTRLTLKWQRAPDYSTSLVPESNRTTIG